ncbi:YbaN family protein [Erysipelotrichaceae bacterium OttesenSCG-928-M19]|nr:YbaN family protein [Erysipelotrichaceae bacterium OttesenSCG-928-M19]
MITKKAVLYFVGFLTLGLGFIGVFLPILPTTPFLIISLTCFASCNEKMYNKILKIKYFNEFIENYRNNSGVTVKTKIRAISTLWLGMLIACFIVDKIIVVCILILIGIGVTIHIYSLKTRMG